MFTTRKFGKAHWAVEDENRNYRVTWDSEEVAKAVAELAEETFFQLEMEDGPTTRDERIEMSLNHADETYLHLEFVEDNG